VSSRIHTINQVWLPALRQFFSRLQNLGGWINTEIQPDGIGLRWTHPIDYFDNARANLTEKLTLMYRKDMLAGYSYKPWIIKKFVPPIRPEDRRLQSESRQFKVQLIAHQASYKQCQTPVEIRLAGTPIDFIPDSIRLDLSKWHRYVLEMTARKYCVFVTLVISSTSANHEFSLLIPSAPPRVKPILRVKG